MSNMIVLPTNYGNISFSSYCFDNKEILVASSISDTKTPFLRIHSSCVFSESFKTIDCDCSRQLDSAIEFIAENGGLIIYSYQEGRGVGLIKKIEAIKLQQDLGLNTAEAFKELGYEKDPRNYDAVIYILRELKINEVILDTSNPNKIDALKNAGITVVDTVKLQIKSSKLIEKYRKDKTACLGHHE